MKLSTLQKFGGISLILGSLLLTAYSVLFSFLLPVNEIRHDMTTAVLNPNWIAIAAVAFFGVIFMVFGFAAVYSKIYEESGALGFLGYIMIEIAYILQACKVTWEICLYPVIAGNQGSITLLRDFILQHSRFVTLFGMTARTTIFLGIILFCTALMRSKQFPKLGGALVFAGALIYGLGPLLSVVVAINGIVILSIGCLILGLNLMSSKVA
jgi:hypothetical protein